MAPPLPEPLTSFEEKVTQRLIDLDLSLPELAARVALPEALLRSLCQQRDPRCSELLLLGMALRIDPVYFLPATRQQGNFNQAGIGNIQKIKIGKAAAHQLAAQLGVCRHALEMAGRLVQAQEEIISLLREKAQVPAL